MLHHPLVTRATPLVTKATPWLLSVGPSLAKEDFMTAEDRRGGTLALRDGWGGFLLKGT